MNEQKVNKICEVVNSLMTLSMLNQDVLHISVQYNPHVQWVECDVVHASNDYNDTSKAMSRLLLNEKIKITRKTAVNELLALEDKLVDLVAEARANA